MASAPTLNASYTSPITRQQFSSALPVIPTPGSTDQKSVYLASLRTKVSELQDRVNVYLTQQMEDDKAREAAAAGSDGKKVTSKDEEREEELYGEEAVEED